jgi:hypothetical protein
MNRHDEIRLKQLEKKWRTDQKLAGSFTLGFGLLTLAVGVCLMMSPRGSLASMLCCAIVLLLVSCWRLLSSAAKVATIDHLLSPARVNSEIVDAEVVDYQKRGY